MTKNEKTLVVYALGIAARERLAFCNQFCTQPDNDIDDARDQALLEADEMLQLRRKLITRGF